MKDFIRKIIKGIKPYGFDYLVRRIKYPSLRLSKYRGYKPAGGMGDKLQIYIDYVKNGTNIDVKNIFEIGANFAQDADYLMEQFKLSPNSVYVFEAHPEIYEAIKKLHKFNAYNNAVYNEEKELEFNIYPLSHINTGVSSIFDNGGKKIKINSIRMDNFMRKNDIETIDFLKIDVERATFHVLDGFGEKLTKVKCVQLETEHNKWAVVSYEKVVEILLKNDFELIYFARNNYMRQSDSFWVKREYINYSGC
ncbi:MAG: FkbM family methyltransferase [Tannerellaceae bacterium]|jgi:FkbM family methyltransferase|nr:FkbM family methyltransferase [Tannerellaceae bacterium]